MIVCDVVTNSTQTTPTHYIPRLSKYNQQVTGIVQSMCLHFCTMVVSVGLQLYKQVYILHHLTTAVLFLSVELPTGLMR